MKYKIRFILLFISFHYFSFTQEEIPLNNPIYDNQAYHFGFTLGLSHTKFSINYSELFNSQNGIDQILSKYEPGFNVGIILDLRITENTNFRITPSFNFTDYKLYYTNSNIETTRPNNSTGISSFELPMYLKYRSDRINNGRTYLLLGGNFIIDMGSIEQLTVASDLQFQKINYSIDIGWGIDIYFAYFKFSPEIKYSYGLHNILVDQDNIYSNMIERLSTRGILISLTFE